MLNYVKVSNFSPLLNPANSSHSFHNVHGDNVFLVVEILQTLSVSSLALAFASAARCFKIVAIPLSVIPLAAVLPVKDQLQN